MSAPTTVPGVDIFKRDGWRVYKHPITGAELPGKSEIIDLICVDGKKFEIGIGYAIKCRNLGKNPFVDRTWKANTGTLAHYLVEQDLRGNEVRAPEGCDPEMVRLAFVAHDAFRKWRQGYIDRGSSFEVVAIEAPLVDGQLGYGTTLDAVFRIDGALVIVDWKTGKLNPEMTIAAAAMWHMWNRHSLEQSHVVAYVQIPTDGTEPIETRIEGEKLRAGAQAFTAACAFARVAFEGALKIPKPVKHETRAPVTSTYEEREVTEGGF